ncbi:hypothetical protein TrVE_jg7161 [Triparma verrucosa]|uniref:Uncharacterized protein n=2 Tax=Triparma TaxID=722752 RepID=A0A9W7C6H0_9STRA|nr:hypothetical protein TrST_g1750 [Triparma strigata]GMI15162.1 hypothetical protein TrVE_jg7161 [Triparma verrucosa]
MFGSSPFKRRNPTPSSPSTFSERSPPSTPTSSSSPSKSKSEKALIIVQSPPSQDMEFRKEKERLERVIKKFADQGEELAPTFLKPLFQYLPSLTITVLVFLKNLSPLIIFLHEKYIWAIENLPVELLSAFWGLTLCFFGGTFQLSLSAYEAFKVSGYDRTRTSLIDLKDAWIQFKKANDVDDVKDEDGDGVRDVEQMETQALVTRKVRLFLKVSDPLKVQDALNGLSSGFIGVIATLKFKYARTVTLGCTIGNYLRRPVTIYLTPTLVQVCPEDLRKWLPYVVDYGCKVIAVSVAWFVSSVLASVQSSIRGGLMFSRGVIKYGRKRGWVDVDTDESMVDEYLGWGVAVLGASFQIVNGFGLPFPLNVLLLPVTMVEYYLKWVVSSKD